MCRNRYGKNFARTALRLVRILLLLLWLFSLWQCALLLDQLESDPIRSTCPDRRNALIGPQDTIAVDFAAEVDHTSAESLVSITALQGPIAGVFSWKEERLEFHPQVPLTAGCRYSLKIRGNLRLRNGREYPVNRTIPFFYLQPPTSAEATVQFEPKNGSTLTKHTPLVLTFSNPVEKAQLVQDLRISPFAHCTLQWNAAGTRLTISPQAGWENHCICRVEFTELPYPSAAYPVEFEQPDVLQVEIMPVELDWQHDFPQAECGLSAVPAGDSIQFRFSRAVDQPECESAIAFEPLCSGSFYWKDALTAVFIPNTPFEPSTTYHCSLTPYSPQSPLQQAEFITAQEFTIAPVLPRIVSLQGEGGDSFPEDLESALETVIDITPSGAEGIYSFLLEYEQPVSDPHSRARLQAGSYCSTLFPSDLPAPNIVSFFWPDSTHLLVQVQGLGRRADGRESYYAFHLPEVQADPGVLQVRVCP